jgi:hypothetical protein
VGDSLLELRIRTGRANPEADQGEDGLLVVHQSLVAGG